MGPELDALDAEQLKALEERKEHVKKKLLAPLSNVGISALGSRNNGGKVRTSDGENDNNEQNGCVSSLVQPSLKKWSHHSRRDTVNTIALELIHAVQNRRSESPRQVSLIVALCELLEISARLWSCSRKNYSANRSDGANEDYEVYKMLRVRRVHFSLLKYVQSVTLRVHIRVLHSREVYHVGRRKPTRRTQPEL